MSRESHPHPNFVRIFQALAVLTVVEIFAANLPLAKFHVVFILVAFAVIKAALVGMFYMHLRYEKILLTVLLVGPLLLSFILTFMVGADIGHPDVPPS